MNYWSVTDRDGPVKKAVCLVGNIRMLGCAHSTCASATGIQLCIRRSATCRPWQFVGMECFCTTYGKASVLCITSQLFDDSSNSCEAELCFDFMSAEAIMVSVTAWKEDTVKTLMGRPGS